MGPRASWWGPVSAVVRGLQISSLICVWFELRKRKKRGREREVKKKEGEEWQNSLRKSRSLSSRKLSASLTRTAMVFFFVSFLFFLLFIVLCFLGFYFGQHFESTIDLLFDDEDDIYDDRLGNLIQTRILYCFFFNYGVFGSIFSFLSFSIAFLRQIHFHGVLAQI